MRRLHTFTLRFAQRRQVYSGEVWAARDGRLLVRFHCPTESDYDESYQIAGLTAPDLTESALASAEPDDDVWPSWIPECVRDRWDFWLSSVI